LTVNHTPQFIFFLSKGDIVAFHITQKKYYHVAENDFESIKKISKGESVSNKKHKTLLEIGFDKSSLDVIWEGDTPSHIIHQASRLNQADFPRLSKEESVKQFTEVSQASSSFVEKNICKGEEVDLPAPKLEDLSCTLKDCFLTRKTCREFFPYNLNLQDISTMLYACFGQIHGDKRSDMEEIGLTSIGVRKSAPSATGLNACRAILWANTVSDIPLGLYAYNDTTHKLYKLPNKLTDDDLAYAAIDQLWVKDLSAGIFIVNDLQKMWIKDKTARGYLATHQESGHVSQNILLSATSLGLHTWITGSFRDDFVLEKLLLDSDEFVSLFIGFGKGSNAPVSKEYIKILKNLKT